MKHAITIKRRIDLSGAPWHIEVNGIPLSLCDRLPTEQQVDEDVSRFDQMMREDEAALTSSPHRTR